MQECSGHKDCASLVCRVTERVWDFSQDVFQPCRGVRPQEPVPKEGIAPPGGSFHWNGQRQFWDVVLAKTRPAHKDVLLASGRPNIFCCLRPAEHPALECAWAPLNPSPRRFRDFACRSRTASKVDRVQLRTSVNLLKQTRCPRSALQARSGTTSASRVQVDTIHANVPPRTYKTLRGGTVLGVGPAGGGTKG